MGHIWLDLPDLWVIRAGRLKPKLHNDPSVCRSHRPETQASAQRTLRKLDPPIRKRVVAAINDLGGDPYQPTATRLVGETDVWRVRVGDYRVLYEVVDDRLIVTVIQAGHRREVYDR